MAILPGSGPTITIPSMTFDLMTSTFVFCGLEPSSLVNYTTRWVLPGGEIVDSTASNGRFIVSENRVLIDGTPLPGTLLTVPSVSYVDAGTYTCEGRSTNPGASTLWASASIEIQLKCEFKR